MKPRRGHRPGYNAELSLASGSVSESGVHREPNESGNISAASLRHEVCLVRFDRRHTTNRWESAS